MTLKEKLRPYNIILASGSPRRKQFLTDLGLDFTVLPTNIEEKFPANLQGKDIALYIATQKANAISNLKNNDLIITCDTVVWLDNTALEKPADEKEATEMLQKLSGKTHQVISAVCIKSVLKQELLYDITEVTFNDLCEKDIHYYVKNFKPFDKAGAYGIQEWIGLTGIEKLNGSYTNVVGMPVEKLYKQLNQF
ncbi:MAG TPA: Maf family nucleotide pyrophosphatase [Flavobacterium sp.]|nr:Maf family nucleotide pyrophosphatase [Flavobacterium sp.]